MSNDSAHVHHAIDYIELTVTDMAEARRFYAAAFGWQFNDYGPDYTGIVRMGGMAGGKEAGGMVVGPVTRGGALVVLYSADLDASLAAVKAAGGTIVKDIFSFPGGRRFQFTDPAGNELAVWGSA